MDVRGIWTTFVAAVHDTDTVAGLTLEIFKTNGWSP